MKPFYLLIAFIATTFSSTAQINGGLSYSLSLPLQEMKQNIRPVHGLNVAFMSGIKKLNKFSWGVEGSLGLYAAFTKDQDIRFPDGTGINTKVTYTSNVVTAGVLTRYHFYKEAKVNPYLSAKLGYANFFSKVIVADPEHEDDCKPLDKKTPIKDHSWYAAYGGGVKIDISQRRNPKNVWLDFSISSLHGTRVDYINIKDIKHNVQNDPNNPAPISDKTVPLSIRFVNVSTQTIHEHQLAEVYTSPLRLLEFKVGVIWRLDD